MWREREGDGCEVSARFDELNGVRVEEGREREEQSQKWPLRFWPLNVVDGATQSSKKHGGFGVRMWNGLKNSVLAKLSPTCVSTTQVELSARQFDLRAQRAWMGAGLGI